MGFLHYLWPIHLHWKLLKKNSTYPYCSCRVTMLNHIIVALIFPFKIFQSLPRSLYLLFLHQFTWEVPLQTSYITRSFKESSYAQNVGNSFSTIHEDFPCRDHLRLRLSHVSIILKKMKWNYLKPLTHTHKNLPAFAFFRVVLLLGHLH